MRKMSAQLKSNPAFKRIQPLPLLAGVAAARPPAAGTVPGGRKFPLPPASERAGRLNRLPAPKEITGASHLLTLAAWPGGGRLFA